MDHWEPIFLTMNLMNTDLGLSEWELILILIIVLILFGANRLPDLARGMGESVENFLESIENWKRGTPGISREQRRQSSDSRPWVFIVLLIFAAAISLSVLRLSGFSGEQKLVLAIVLLGWIAVGYWSFGRNFGKGNGR